MGRGSIQQEQTGPCSHGWAADIGKSYLLKGLIELAKSKGLIVSKLAPSGVAAHPIGGTTVHNFLSLNIECNSTPENGIVQVTKLRKTDVIVIDEFSMLPPTYLNISVAHSIWKPSGYSSKFTVHHVVQG